MQVTLKENPSVGRCSKRLKQLICWLVFSSDTGDSFVPLLPAEVVLIQMCLDQAKAKAFAMSHQRNPHPMPLVGEALRGFPLPL